MCLEEFSTLSGFSDDQPINQFESLVEKNIDEDILNDPINENILSLLDLFSNIFNITIDDKFKVDIINIYLYIDSKQLASIRYNDNDITVKPVHPRIKNRIDEINTNIKSTKDKKERKSLEKEKEEEFEEFQLWLHNTNRFISILAIFILLNQLSSLTVVKKMDILDIESRDINDKLLTYISTKILKSIKYIDDKRLDYLEYILIDEKLKCNDLKKQLENSIHFIKTYQSF